MQAGSITAVNQAAQSGGTSVRQPLKDLDKNAFLQLLVAQLKNQDPFAPQDTNSFLMQLAQFSMLEQLTAVSQGLEGLRRSQELAEGAALLGKTVRVCAQDVEVTGAVEKVTLTQGEVKIVVKGQPYSLSEIAEVLP